LDTVRIAALLEPFLEAPLSPDRLDQLSMYIDLLLRWNARINLTAIRSPEEIVTRHFGESFFMARHLFPNHPERDCGSAPGRPKALAPAALSPPRVIDIGSGAGFPALPLKIWAPHLRLTLIEANQKKATFLREVARALTLINIDISADRAENFKTGELADVVTFRAVEKFDRILPIAASLLSPAGRLAILIGTSQVPALQCIMNMKWDITVLPLSAARVMAIGNA
jgi:16S rRNA (guanine527-N7)-methyltransferase